MYLRRPIFSPGRADELDLFQALATASDRLESAKNPTSPATNTTAQSHIPVWEPDGGCPSGWSFAAITESQPNSVARWLPHPPAGARPEGMRKEGATFTSVGLSSVSAQESTRKAGASPLGDACRPAPRCQGGSPKAGNALRVAKAPRGDGPSVGRRATCDRRAADCEKKRWE